MTNTLGYTTIILYYGNWYKRVVKDIFNSLTDIFQSENKSVLMKHEAVALSNLVSIAKERLWIADSLDTLEYDTTNFTEDLSDDTRNKIKQSIKVMETFLEKN